MYVYVDGPEALLLLYSCWVEQRKVPLLLLVAFSPSTQFTFSQSAFPTSVIMTMRNNGLLKWSLHKNKNGSNGK